MRISLIELNLRTACRHVGDVAMRFMRPPYAREFIPCTCNAVHKDDCRCIRAWLDLQEAS